MEHGIVRDWDDMEALWNYVYSDECLGVSSAAHPLLLTEAPLNPRRNREKAAEIFFERMNVPAMFVSPQATLSLYGSGRTTGVVLDVGDGVAHCVPVYEGFAVAHAVQRVDVAGRDVTDYLMTLLRKAGYAFHTSAEREVVKAVKEQACYVAYNPAKMEEDFRGPRDYILPDGKPMKLGAEQYAAPEVLFNPALVGAEYRGVHQCLADCISRCDIDLRKALYYDVVLAGGSTMFSGFGQRLLNEVRKLAPPDTKLRISAPPEADVLTWTGGAILASLSTFSTMWLRRDEYEEGGAARERIHKLVL